MKKNNNVFFHSIVRKCKVLNIAVQFVVLISFVCLFAANVNSAVASPFVRGIRPLGMGGAFTAVADDYNALMYNPAGLANIKYPSFTLFQFDIGTQSKTLDIISWLSSNMTRLSNSDITTWTQADIDKIANAAVKLSVNAELLTLAIKNFGLGAFASVNANVGFETGIFIPKANIDVSADGIVPLSYARYITGLDEFFHNNLGGGKLAVGATVKFVGRTGLTETRTALELTSLDATSYLNKISNIKTGFGFDLGLLFNAEEIMDSDFALVMNDIYTNIGGDRPAMNLRFGYAYKPKFDIFDFVFTSPVLALDINDITNSNVTFFNKIHIGLEFQLIRWLSIRGGFYQGYPSYGVGIPLGPLKLEFASYGLELGKYPGQKEERNYVGTIGLRF